MKKSFYWSLMFIAGLLVVGAYSSHVLAEDGAPLDEGAPVVETPVVDVDGDTVADADDNCPSDPNEDQLDSDEDGLGDVCDETPLPEPTAVTDTDGDTVADDVDNCDAITNLDQADADADGEGDVCEPAPEVLGSSTGSSEDTPVADPVVEEIKDDGTAFWETLTEDDATDGDFDNDGISDEDDNCLIVSNKDQADEDENDIGDVCEEAGFGEGPTEDVGFLAKAFSFVLPPDPDVHFCHYTGGGYTYGVDTTLTEVIALLHALLPGHSNDIVEPFHFGFLNILYHPGRNWTPANEEFLANECQPVTKLTVIKNVENNFGGEFVPSNFTLHVTWYNGNSNDAEPWTSFSGDSDGTSFSDAYDDLNPGDFLVGEDWVPGYSMVIDTNEGPRCAGGQTLHDDEQLTCTVTNKQLAYGGNEEPMCGFKGEGWYGEYFNYPHSRDDMYSIYEGDPILPGDDGSMLWGQPIDPASDAAEWYDTDGEYFRFSRVDTDLEFGDMFWPFYGDLVEEETYGSGRDFNFGVHWSATVDVPSDDSDYNFYGKFDDDVFVYVNGVLDVDSSAPGAHGPVGVTGQLHLSDGDVIDVFYADRAQGGSTMYMEFINNSDDIEGNEITFTPNNDSTDCESLTLSCDPEVNLIKNGGFEDPEVTANGGDWELFSNVTPLLEWFAQLVSDNSSGPVEIQSGYSGWLGADGSEQYAELDVNVASMISQDVPTIPGETYHLTYQRAARPGTSPAEDNAVEALVDGVPVDSSVFNVVDEGPLWYPSPVISFVASDTTTRISFKDIGPTQGGSSNGLGIFVDDVDLRCVPPVPTTATVTLCKYDENENELPNWQLMLKGNWVEQLFVDSTDQNGTDTVNALNGGTSYLAFAEGTWANQNGANIADAEYSTTDAWVSNVMDGYDGYSQEILELNIGGDLNSFGNWGPYMSDHTYVQGFTPVSTGTVPFVIFDGESGAQNPDWFGDNSGSLRVDIFQGYTGVTDGSGCVTFEDVPFGEYSVEEVMQDGWYNISGLGYHGIYGDTTIDVVNSDAYGTVSGWKWNDHNNDGDQGEGDEGLEGWTIYAYEQSAPEFSAPKVALDDSYDYSTTTDEDGNYTLELPEGSYYVCEELQVGWNQTFPDTDNGCYAVQIEDGEDLEGYDFGNHYGEEGGDGESCLVSGYKYDEAGNPLEGWTIGLEGTYPSLIESYYGGFLGEDVTNANGYYCISGVVDGPGSNYRVYEELQDGWTPVGVSINGEASTTPSFGEETAYVDIPYIGDGMDVNFYNDDASVAGYKWNDENGDGDNNEDGEPMLSNWPISLYYVGEGWDLVATTTTDDSGEFSFGGLSGSDTYALCEGSVEGWTQTYPIGEQYPNNCYIVALEDGEDAAGFAFGNHGNESAVPPQDNNSGNPGGHNKGSQNFGGGEVLGATTDTQFCPYLIDYLNIDGVNNPSEVNKAKAFFNAYLGLDMVLDGIFDQTLFNAVVTFQNMFKQDVLDPWVDEYPFLDGGATGYIYQTTIWKINSLVCPGYQTFPETLIVAPSV